MKRLTCEMCGSTDLIKQDGVFVCQSCGCKYSVEEARKMMIEGTVEVTGTVRVDDTETKKEQIQNYLKMAQSLYEGDDFDGAIGYCDRILDIDANIFDAWLLKTKAAIDGVVVLNGNDKIQMASMAAKRVVELAPDTKKYDVALEIYNEIKTQILDGATVLNAKDIIQMAIVAAKGVVELAPDAKKYDVASEVYNAIKSKIKRLLDDGDVQLIMKYHAEAAEAIEFTHNMMLKWLTSLSDIPFLGNSLIEAEINDCGKLESSYHLRGRLRVSSEAHNNNVRYFTTFRKVLSEKIKLEESREEEFKAKAKAEADAKRAAYWDAHADEKMALEQHKIEAEARIAALEAEMEALPELARKKDLDERITALKNEREQLGLFKMKEKKAIQAQIDEMQINLSTIEKSLAEKASPIQEKIDAEKAIISETNAELTMER